MYDAVGRLLKAKEFNALGQLTGETHYVYDGLNTIAELNGSDTLIAAFTHGPGIDDPLMMRYDGADYYYLKNHQGSVLEVTTAAGTNTKTYKYDAFGNIMQETGPTINRGFTYTSRQFHTRSGLYYYRARWYSPELGRFLTPDPVAFDGVNLYAYVQNNAVNLIDPYGLFWQYSQATGQMIYVDNQTGASTPLEIGYSGHEEGLNNPDMQDVEKVGPIPQGTYDIGKGYKHERLGPVTMNLDPRPGTEMFGRIDFRIHGDNAKGDRSASEGCIVLSRKARDQINNSEDRKLRVVP